MVFSIRRPVAGLVAFSLATAFAVGPASAHSPYLLPNGFTLERDDDVTVLAAFSEHVFAPAIAMQSEAFNVVTPDGSLRPLQPVMLRDMAVLEVPTPEQGTYRISSGERLGRMAKAALIDGRWEFIDPRRPLPAGVTPVDMQSVTKAEVYVSRGSPSQLALAPTGRGIEYRAVTHPAAIRAGRPAEFELLYDGKPLPNADVEVEQGRLGEVENVRLPLIVSDAQGRFTITAPQPGLYFAMTRYRVAAAEGLPARSYTYALTYSVSE